MRIAVLDDYQSAVLSFDCWQKLPPEVKLVVFTDHVHDEDRLVERLRHFDAVMRFRERTPLRRRVIEQLPQLKLILATGTRNGNSIDIPAARERGIVVCSTDSVDWPTPELTWTLILALFRGIVAENASVRAGGWQVGLGSSIAGKVLGVMGLGKLGMPVSRIGLAFGMRVVAWSPNLTPERTAPHGVECVSKEELFSLSDVVTLHMPAGPRTKGIVGADDIARMKPTAYLVNTSRGSLVDDDALIGALAGGRIAGAGIDVFETEPLPTHHPYRYLPTVLATPHLGYTEHGTYTTFFTQTVENILAFQAGRPIRMLDDEGKRIVAQ